MGSCKGGGSTEGATERVGMAGCATGWSGVNTPDSGIGIGNAWVRCINELGLMQVHMGVGRRLRGVNMGGGGIRQWDSMSRLWCLVIIEDVCISSRIILCDPLGTCCMCWMVLGSIWVGLRPTTYCAGAGLRRRSGRGCEICHFSCTAVAEEG